MRPRRWPEPDHRRETEPLLDAWIGRAALADQIGVSVDTLSRWESRRCGPPCIRLGRRVLYRIEGVRECLVRQDGRRGFGK